MTTGRVLIPLAALALAVSGAARAREGDVLRFGGAWVDPTGDLKMEDREVVPLGDGTTLTAVARVSLEADSAFGFFLDYEKRVSDLVGIDFAVMHSDHDLDLRGSATVQIRDDATNAVLFDQTESVSATAGVDMTPFLVGANFHFGSHDRVDLYAGPFVGFVTFGDVEFEGDRIELKDEFAYGATLGLDVPFGQAKMAFSAVVRYMIASAEDEEPGGDALDVDPLIVLLGLGYRF